MWYKYMNKTNHNLIRVFRRCNLKFNSDDNGFMKAKKPGIMFQYVARLFKSQGPLRGSTILFSLASLNAYLWYSGEKAKEEAPMRAQKAKASEDADTKAAQDSLWFNRFNVASRPNRSMENFMTFLASGKMMNLIFEYIAYEGTVSAYEDYQKGLDGVATDEDRKMLDYYKESLKHKSHH